MNWDRLERAVQAVGLSVRGAFHPGADDATPSGTGTLAMLGPDEPEFWPLFKSSTEAQDGLPDPLDRWSKRVIGQLASDFGGIALFPSDGPPYPPFLSWAQATGRAHIAPVGLLVHDTAGLFLSFRGALALPHRLEIPAPPPNPCRSCTERPCETACPVQALSVSADYDVPVCAAHVTSPLGQACLNGGCQVRRACPVSQTFGRVPEQSAFHMRAFVGM